MSSSSSSSSSSSDVSDEASSESLVLTGEMVDGVLYLVDQASRRVFSSSERDANDEPVCVGTLTGDGKVVLSYPYASSNPEDHCETPRCAYEDVLPILDRLRGASTRRSELRIYDPFYCDGAVKRHLASLGFTTVHNEPADFWKTVEQQQLPEFDVLVTNPPFSGDNIERLLKICLALNKPFLLLVPNWFYTKPYFTSLGASARSPMLVVPSKRYEFHSPQHLRVVDKKAQLSTAPFVTIWFCFVAMSHQQPLLAEYMSKSAAVASRSVRLYLTPRDLPPQFKSSYDRSRKSVAGNFNGNAKKRAFDNGGRGSGRGRGRGRGGGGGGGGGGGDEKKRRTTTDPTPKR
jgi:hypothetical protein